MSPHENFINFYSKIRLQRKYIKIKFTIVLNIQETHSDPSLLSNWNSWSYVDDTYNHKKIIKIYFIIDDN